MYRGCRRWVYSLVCAFCILCMLFLDTCTVNASNSSELFDSYIASGVSSNVSVTLNVNPSNSIADLEYLQTAFSFSESGTISTISNVPSSYRGSGSGTISNSTSQSNVNYYTYHFSVPINCFVTSSGVNFNDLYGCILVASNISCSTGSISNFKIVRDNTVISMPNSNEFPITYSKGYEITDGNTGNNNSVGYYANAEFDYTFSSDDFSISDNDSISTTCSFTLISFIGHVNTNISDEGISVHDTVTQEELTEMNETATDTNTKITDFFGSFFDNLLHIFVPEDGYFSTWFDKVNTLLSEKLGMLYAPFDLVISTLQAIYSSSTTESGIPFPGIKWEDTWLVEPFTFTFASLGSDFDDLRDKVYFATDTVLVLTFLMLLQSKVKLILEGHE